MRGSIKHLVLASTLIASVVARGAPANPDAQAAVDSDTLTTSRVEVKAIRSPARWPYRALLEGLDTFENQRGLAPRGA